MTETMTGIISLKVSEDELHDMENICRVLDISLEEFVRRASTSLINEFKKINLIKETSRNTRDS